ncbi:hydrolase [Lactiplantibacillus pentosus]|uniref:Putative cell surface hydrolase n=2 Tax=Lactiplantibacillus pentosus TaxID=1589 RepID=G0LZG5_LACPE|nr:alpha/beta hydrolase [Lactiplantibacillus pentosus]CCC18061.1 putative cell surface hydrolase [Lactiplantibacillus pentosus IG1]AYG40587.1 alpha/beta hydrolase [Lactiplantibacillus pentosus]MCT3284700.1 alpha/beta hydrolase [Lactiplantibacillus pentosus]MCT3303196.1 alpha/beta hydrolase [Lactiplantibacillus pentosus]
MKQMKWWLLTLLLVFGLAGCTSQAKPTSTKSRQSTSQKRVSAYIDSTTPTFYVHGFQGSAKSTNTLIKHAEKTAHAHKVLVATVSTSGTVTLTGKWQGHVRNPIIQVVFKNNLAQYDQQSAWLAKVITTVQQQHAFKQYNIVAHSAGCVASVNMLMTKQTADFPSINKLVTIAGPFDGVVGEDDVANQNSFLASGQPKYLHAAYELLAAKRTNFPTHVHLLNIVGTLNDGSHSDSLVTNVSARSIKYLLRGRSVDYTEKDFYGKHAQHSQLHENAHVALAVDRYLWHR